VVTLGDQAAVPYPEQPGFGTPPRRTSVRAWWGLTVSGVALAAAVVVGTWASTHHGAAPRGAACVVVHAASPDDELRATGTPCGTDPSFTVVKGGAAAANCAARRYVQFRPPFADQATGRLCLVPNLVVGHCYRFGVPVGMWELSRCVGRAVIKVTKRVDSEDARVCPVDPPAAPGMAQLAAQPRALAYPSRTYCYADVPGK
jgi:hypothetical protein